MTSRQRTRAFLALVVGCTLIAAAIVAVGVGGARGKEKVVKRALARARPAVASVLDGSQPFVVMREIDRSRPSEWGRIVVAPIAGDRRGAPLVAGPACDRVAYRAGAGLCLGSPGFSGFAVQVLDGRLHVRHTRELPGVPSRARISPDGRWGGVTGFVTGHAYANPGSFSTSATVIDLRTGRPVGDLEHDFAVSHDGRPVTARNRNYWGITFAPDGDTFYATL